VRNDGPHRLEMQRWTEHGGDCEHWEAVWTTLLP